MTRPKKTVPSAERGQSGKPLERALGPIADEFGKAAAPLGERAGKVTVYVGDKLLGMLEQSVFGLEKVAEWVRTEVSKRLREVPEQNIAEPNPRIAVPAVQALTYSMGEEHIRSMFANLLSADMNADLKQGAHPAFVEIIKEMMPLDAKVLAVLRKKPQIAFKVRLGSAATYRDVTENFSFQIENATEPQITTSISNLERLGLVRKDWNETPVLEGIKEQEEKIKARYEPVRQRLVEIRKALEDNPDPGTEEELKKLPPHGEVVVAQHGVFLTPLGSMFASVCL